MSRSDTSVFAWGLLLLSSLCCLPAAAALECPPDVVTLTASSTPTNVTLQTGKSYQLGAGVFVLVNTVEVAVDDVLCVAGVNRVGAPAGTTRLLSPAEPKQLHFAQYGGLLWINNLQLEGRAGSGGGGGVLIKRSKDGTEDNQPATFVARLVTFKSISPRAVANDDDTNANLTFTNCAFMYNVYDTWGCTNDRGWLCLFTGPPGAAGVTTASNATFKGSTTFWGNSWGALYVASPVTVAFEGGLLVAHNTKKLGWRDDYGSDNFTSPYGAGLYASGGAHLLFSGAAAFRNNTGEGGCAMALSSAKATFTSAARTVSFTWNYGSYGAALKAYNSSILFNGNVVLTDNRAVRGAGGAFHLELSDVTFNSTATIRNNSLNECTMDFDSGCGGGAMFVLGSKVVHNNRATYQSNTASTIGGGAVAISHYSYSQPPVNSSFFANQMVLFIGNAATHGKRSLIKGGAIWMASDVTFAGGAQFLSNWASPEGQYGSGGAVYIEGSSTLTFGGPAIFRNNSASMGGAVTLGEDGWSGRISVKRMVFSNSKSSSCWIRNYASVGAEGGAALRIEAYGTAEFGTQAQHNFGANIAGSKNKNDIRAEGSAVFTCGGGRVRGGGSYSIIGDVCGAGCVGAVCQCPAGQAFAANACRCQRNS